MLVCRLSMLNECSGKGRAPVGHPLSMVSQIKSWNSFTVWCQCDRARCLGGSLQLDLRCDSGKQQLEDHFEVLEDIILSIKCKPKKTVFRRFLDHAT